MKHFGGKRLVTPVVVVKQHYQLLLAGDTFSRRQPFSIRKSFVPILEGHLAVKVGDFSSKCYSSEAVRETE
ncbi:hypothetical protein TTRE_0000649801 [Trichuris trichiura]|uniref:Uncharacterized protein n=1 Tax=Trichuris trichiura TaxID=36087 RepID=A0A077ZFB3_TRITR|nr:hypothetical protein TTRE_0000649801 [Trichuris trichiura]